MKSKLLLPNPSEMLRKSKSLAMLDAIYCQQWDLRYFSHNSKWGCAEEMGSMRDGEGNDYFILFSPGGTAMKGCFIEGGASGGLLDEIRSSMPSKFRNFVNEPAFSINESSFVAWFDERNDEWTKIGAPEGQAREGDGSEYLTGWIRGDGIFYRDWASVYYEKSIDLSLVRHIFNFQPLDVVSLKRLDIDLDERQLFEDINEIGYPCM